MSKSKLSPKKGFFLLELLLVMAIVTVILSGVSLFIAIDRESLVKSDWRQIAANLAEQQMERVNSVAGTNWSLLANGEWHLGLTGSEWQLLAGEQEDGNFRKKVIIDPVYRTADGAVSDESGFLDPSSKKITSRIAWNDPVLRELSTQLILANYAHHQVWTEDTLADFQDGVDDTTDITTNPGFIQLAQTGGGGQWTEPTIIGLVDCLAKGNGILAYEGYLYFTLGASHNEVEVFNIATDPAHPVSLGSFSLGPEGNRMTAHSTYLYVSLKSTSNNLKIYDLSVSRTNPSYVKTITIQGEPNGLWVQNGYLFATISGQKTVRVYRLSDPINPVYLGTFSTPQNTLDVSGSGNYLYIAQSTTNNGLQVYDISTSAINPVNKGGVITYYQPTGIWLEGSTIYLSMDRKRAAMYTLTGNPTSPLLLGIFATNRNTSDVTALGDYGYIAGDDSQGKAIEVAYVGDSKGFSGTYFVYGEYLSSTLALAGQSSFYRLAWEGTTPIGTEIRLQTAINNDNFTWNYIGPDGTGSSYFENPGSIYFPSSLGRYLKYKIILTGDGNQTPQVDKVRVTYAE